MAVSRKKNAAIAATPPASPSMLSKKFIALMTTRIQTTLMIPASTPLWTNSESRTPNSTRATATMSSTTTFGSGPSPRVSSTRPSTKTQRPPTRMTASRADWLTTPAAYCRTCSGTIDASAPLRTRSMRRYAPSTVTTNAVKIATPPMSGVGRISALSGCGVASRPYRRARRRHTGTRADEIASATTSKTPYATSHIVGALSVPGIRSAPSRGAAAHQRSDSGSLGRKPQDDAHNKNP